MFKVRPNSDFRYRRWVAGVRFEELDTANGVSQSPDVGGQGQEPGKGVSSGKRRHRGWGRQSHKHAQKRNMVRGVVEGCYVAKRCSALQHRMVNCMRMLVCDVIHTHAHTHFVAIEEKVVTSSIIEL